MLRAGHYGAAMVAYVPVLLALGPENLELAIGGLIATLLAARLPDLDQRIPFVPHRGPTHTLWFAGFAAMGSIGLVLHVAPDPAVTHVLLAAAAPVVGVLSHLVADALTPAGVKPLWPFLPTPISFGLVTANNWLANRVLFLGGLGALLLTVFARIGVLELVP